MLQGLQKKNQLPPLENNPVPVDPNNIFQKKPLGPSNAQQPPQPAGKPLSNAQKNIELPAVNISNLNQNININNNENIPPNNQSKLNNQREKKKERRQGIKKNITDNKINFPQDIPQQDLVGEDYNFEGQQDSLAYLVKEAPQNEGRYKENLKTGEFIFISKKQMELEEAMKGKSQVQDRVLDDDAMWYKLIDDFNSVIFRFVYLLQGLLAGALIIIAIQYLSDNLTDPLSNYAFRLNQSIWIVSLISFFGQFYIFRVCQKRCEFSFTNGSPSLAENTNLKSRALVNMIIYGVVYYCMVVDHYFILVFGYYDGAMPTDSKQSSYKGGYKALIVIAAVFAAIGWFTVGNQTKSNYIEMEYEEDDRTRIGNDSDEEF